MKNISSDLTWPVWPIYGSKELDAINRSLRSGDWSRGKAIGTFEKKYSKYCGSKHCLLVNSGTEALRLVLKALRIGKGDEVIVPGLTWPSTAMAVLEVGAKAVIVDVELDSYGISTEQILRNITKRTKAVIPVHLFNSSADIETIADICNHHNIYLIEDAAQSHGHRWENRQLGTFGIAGIFSFQQKKMLTCGEGGCIITNDTSLYEQLYALRDHGARISERGVDRYGSHCRMATLNAALLLAQLDRLPGIIAKEQTSGILLSKELDAHDGLQCLKRREKVNQQTFYNFCFRLTNKRLINKAAYIRGAMTDVLKMKVDTTYPPLNNGLFFRPQIEKEYQNLLNFRRLNNCEIAYKTSIRFPHYYLLASESMIKMTADIIIKLCK